MDDSKILDLIAQQAQFIEKQKSMDDKIDIILEKVECHQKTINEIQAVKMFFIWFFSAATVISMIVNTCVNASIRLPK